MPMEGYRVVRRWLGPQGGLRAEEQRQATNGKRAAEGAKELPVIVIFFTLFFFISLANDFDFRDWSKRHLLKIFVALWNNLDSLINSVHFYFMI